MPGQYQRIVVHAGRHKSGTSSLQRVLSDASDALAAAGVLYPVNGRRGVAHHPLANAFQDKAGRDPAAAAAVVGQVAAEIADWSGDVVLSSEAFQNVERPTRLAKLIDPERCEVVIYLRERYAYAQSSYAQAVHAKGWSGNFADFLATASTSYDAFLQRWEAFAVARLHVRAYDRSALIDGDVVRDFITAARLPEWLMSYAVPDQNPSIGGALLEFKRALNGLPALPAAFGKGYNVLSRVARRDAAFRIKPEAPVDMVRAFRRESARAMLTVSERHPALAVLASEQPITAPRTFDREDFSAVWRAIEAQSPDFAAACRQALTGAWHDDPALPLIAAADG